jgi:hypothetical protein
LKKESTKNKGKVNVRSPVEKSTQTSNVPSNPLTVDHKSEKALSNETMRMDRPSEISVAPRPSEKSYT